MEHETGAEEIVGAGARREAALSKSWRLARLADARMVEMARFADARGALNVLDNAAGRLGFPIDRCFFLSDVPQGQCRGDHANTRTNEALVAVGGEIGVDLDDGFAAESYRLRPLEAALIVPAGLWITLRRFGQGAVCVVLASGGFSPEGHLTDRAAFTKLKRAARN